MAWTTPETYSSGTILTSTQLNKVRDNLNALATEVSYTPAWLATTTNPTLGNGTKFGRYRLAGDMCHFRISIEFGSTTTAGSGIYLVGLPFTEAAETHNAVYNAALYDASGNYYSFVGVSSGSNSIQCYTSGGGFGGRLASGYPIVYGTGDRILINGFFRPA